MYELRQGPPDNLDGRLEKEKRVYEFLGKLGIKYRYIDHEALLTMEACVEVDKVLEAMICKNLFLCNNQRTQFYLLMLPGDKKLNTRKLSDQLGTSRLTFAEETYMEEFLDITPGSVSVLGLMNDHEHRVQLLVDREVLEGEYIGCHPCINTTSLRILQSDMWEKIIPAMEHEPIFVAL